MGESRASADLLSLVNEARALRHVLEQLHTRYDRRAVDGLWLTSDEVDATVTRLKAMTYAERAANACIGAERADLVLAGCAILEAIRGHFPAQRIRIADRGLREGMLMQMMRADRVWPRARGGALG